MNNKLEIWADVFGYEGKYKISNFGQLKSLDREVVSRGGMLITIKGKLKKPQINYKGYNKVLLNKNGVSKGYFIHRLVGIAFIQNPKNKPQINHKNGIRTDNRVQNLEWCTNTENQIHSFAVLNRKGSVMKKGGESTSSKKVRCDTLEIEKPSLEEMSIHFGFLRQRISEVCTGRKLQYQGLTFRYI